MTSKFLERAWYCAAWAHELRSGAPPLRRILLAQPIVLFRDSERKAHALSAVCPHRGADLGTGTVEGGVLRCPLHGWSFDGSGLCVQIPSQGSGLRVSRLARVRRFELVEQQGILWIWMHASIPDAPPPSYGVWEASPLQRRLFDRPRLWRASFENVVENAIDVAHTPFIHKSTLGDSQPHVVPKQTVVRDDDGRGFSGTSDLEVRPGEQPRAFAPSGAIGWFASWLGLTTVTRETYRFDLGGSVHFHVKWPDGTWDVLAGHATPADTERTWFFGLTVRTRAVHWFGDWVQRWAMRTLSDEDGRHLEAMLSNDPRVLPEGVSVAADAGTLEFARLYSRAIGNEREAPGPGKRDTARLETNRPV